MRIYHTFYRPQDFDEMAGQQHVLKPLAAMVAKGLSHCFLFTGPTGTGKTTLARIVADKFKVQPGDILEFDASTTTGIEDVRWLQEQLRYRPFSGGNKAIIVDEAHGLSKQAWNALLKVTEEPPAYIFFFLCTTDPGKVPKTIVTRFARFDLRPLPVRDLIGLLTWVVKEEGLGLHPDVVALVATEADGSARQALQLLAKVHAAASVEEAATALESARLEDAPDVGAWMQFVNRPGSWSRGLALIDKLEDFNAEGVRIQTLHYLAKVAKGAKSDRAAIDALRKMEAFQTPYNPSNGRTELVLSLGKVLFAD
jgi:DNA polymerase III gamma/tau subunit